jgi:ubiquinone/menaquinone biosynthesis C-methylase UbiE
MRLILFLLRTAYSLLYHQFAWKYDLVADAVSLGHWKDWVRVVLPHLDGRVLEIGYGPGHLQLAMQAQGLTVFGVDESRQMVRLVGRRLRKKGLLPGLSRGYAQYLPFCRQAFDCVVSTFPSEYIFAPQTLNEVRRVLVPGGKLVIVPMAWITGRSPWERVLAWLLRLVGEAPGKPGRLPEAARERFARAGFQVRSELVKMEGSEVLVVVSRKI